MTNKRIYLGIVLLTLTGYAFSVDIDAGYQDIYEKIMHPDIYQRYLPRSKLIQVTSIRQTIEEGGYDVNHVLRVSKPLLDELDKIVLENLAARLDMAAPKYERIREANPELERDYTEFTRKQQESPDYFITKPGIEAVEAFINTVDARYARINWQEMPESSPPTPDGLQRQGTDRVYLVKKGDFLRKIAQTFYGNERQWTAIYRANPQIKHPDLIYPDMEFRIPPQP